jgi:2-dehydro-3-deoxyglucarate aldolase/4-hydroxy-2-oxoheptanedioate aldolase
VGKNDLKARLKQGERVVGTMLTVFAAPELAKILKVCGFDYFIIDCEHGPFSYGAVANLLAMARETGIAGLVRIPEPGREVILKFMEMGAAGLLLPNADTPEQAEVLVEHSKYLPLGRRGVSMLRAHTGFEKVENPPQYMQHSNEDTVLMAQIESPMGVKNVEAILGVDGIDAAFIGPNDLTQNMGIFGQYTHPDYIAALDHVIASARGKGKFSGIHLMSSAALKPWIDKGMTLNLCGSDVNLFMNAARQTVAEVSGFLSAAK